MRTCLFLGCNDKDNFDLVYIPIRPTLNDWVRLILCVKVKFVMLFVVGTLYNRLIFGCACTFYANTFQLGKESHLFLSRTNEETH